MTPSWLACKMQWSYFGPAAAVPADAIPNVIMAAAMPAMTALDVHFEIMSISLVGSERDLELAGPVDLGANSAQQTASW